MKLSILIVTTDLVWGSDLQRQLISFGYEVEVVSNGKDCQVRASKVKFSVLILDINIENHSSVEVLKFLKISHSSIKIILLAEDKKNFDSLAIPPKSLQRSGIGEVIFKPHSFEKIKARLITILGVSKIKDIKRSEASIDKKKIKDSEVTAISVKEFYSDNISLFDHYLKLSSNNYKRIINRGEQFSPERLKKYEDDGLESLYILTSERMNYINSVNSSIQKAMTKQNDPEASNKLIFPLKNITHKYIEEIHTVGLNPQLVEEGKLICQNMYDLISREVKINSILNDLNEQVTDSRTHSFLVSFFSIYISKHINWAGRRTVDTIALGALLHDIGLLSLPPSIRNLNESAMSQTQFESFKQHPRHGRNLLERSNLAHESLLQIVLQHHEYLDGTGYPNSITGSRIYPLAKIVALADCFSYALIENKTTPKETMKIFLKDRSVLLKFDALMIKGLVQGITS